jgi:hypothetical protein
MRIMDKLSHAPPGQQQWQQVGRRIVQQSRSGAGQEDKVGNLTSTSGTASLGSFISKNLL